MRQVKFMLLIAIAALVVSCKDQEAKQTNLQGHIHGTIINALDNPFIVAYGDVIDTIILNDDNQFDFDFSNDKAAYLNFSQRQNSFQVYLYPGDSIELIFNPENKNVPLEFIKGNTFASNCLNELSKYKQTNEAYKNMLYNTEVDSFLLFVDNAKQDMQEIIKNFSDSINDNNFVELENQRIDYLLFNLKVTYKDYYEYFTGNVGRLDSLSYFNFIDVMPLENEKALVLNEYVDFVNNRLTYLLKDVKFDTYEAEIKASIDVCSENLKNAKINETVTYKMIMEYAKYSGFEEIETEYQNFISNVVSENKKNNIKKLYNTWNLIKSGNQAYNFEFPNNNGDTVSLSDFLGKVVYIDVWATWCGPCRHESPFFDSLENEYRGKNIAFISVSVDDDKDAWLNFVEKEKPEWTQLHTGGWDCSICKDYFIHSIPRFLLIDAEGKIIDATAARPSSEEIGGILDKYIAKVL
jgi:thiol-disulfide isomerase/thioredoxin